MVLEDGHEYERKSAHRLASRRDGSQFCIPPLLGLHGLCAWQGRRAEPSFPAAYGEIGSSNWERVLPLLIWLWGQEARDSL